MIFELESRYLDYDVVMQQGNFLAQFEQVIDRELPADQFAEMYNLRLETVGLMEGLVQELEKIKIPAFLPPRRQESIHFLGNEEFRQSFLLLPIRLCAGSAWRRRGQNGPTICS